MGTDRRLVGSSNRADDGESEPVTILVVRATRIEPLEGLEEAVDFTERYEHSRVGHRHHGVTVEYLGRDVDTTADHIVSYCVTEKVGHQSFDE